MGSFPHPSYPRELVNRRAFFNYEAQVITALKVNSKTFSSHLLIGDLASFVLPSFNGR